VKKGQQKKTQVRSNRGSKTPSHHKNTGVTIREDMIQHKPGGRVEIQVSPEVMDKILNPPEPEKVMEKMENLGIKKASELTEADNLKFELGRLRTFFVTWDTYVEHEGNLYLVQVDPLNKMVKFLAHGGDLGPKNEKLVEQWKKDNGPYNFEGGYIAEENIPR